MRTAHESERASGSHHTVLGKKILSIREPEVQKSADSPFPAERNREPSGLLELHHPMRSPRRSVDPFEHSARRWERASSQRRPRALCSSPKILARGDTACARAVARRQERRVHVRRDQARLALLRPRRCRDRRGHTDHARYRDPHAKPG
jgi:hypothetical protein